MKAIPFSILDLVPVSAGSTPARALQQALDLARHAEQWGYTRYWLAEHHNMTGVAGAATSVVIGYIAGGTRTIRVGAGGVMLPNHSPLVIAEQFGTLASLYPGRIDLGVGRAPGSDQLAARALRRTLSVDTFPQDVVELQQYFKPAEPGQAVQAVPGAGLNVPIWLLGSSLFGAQLAATLGLPYAFASHFAPDALEQALHLYRTQFKPSDMRAEPYVMLAVNVVAANTDAEAQRLFTSVQQQFINLRRGTPGPLPPPVDQPEWLQWAAQQAGASHALRHAVVGSPATIRSGLTRFIDQYQPDELITTAQIFDHPARLRSFELVAQVRDTLAEAATPGTLSVGVSGREG